MNHEPESKLVIPRLFAIRLLHEAQLAGAQDFLAAVGASAQPDRYFLADDPADLVGLLKLAEAHFAGQSRQLWSIFLHRPDLPAAPVADDFVLRPELLRLTSSLATKGVLQLRAWSLEGGQVVERLLCIEE